MAFQCGFFNSINGDRKYNAEQMNNPFSKIVSNGVFGDAESSTDLQVVSNSGLSIIVKKGQGMFAGKWAILDADLPLTVDTPHVSMKRIDSIIVRIDTSDEVRAGSIEYVKGVAGTSPSPAKLQNTTNIKEYRLANITVNPNVTEITQANIEDCRPTSECGFIHNLLWDSDITATYSQWHAQFEEWFNNLKLTLSSVTAISSFTSRYITTEQDEVDIPIQILRYNSVLDILQVYINGLICIEGIDYTITDNDTIKLINGVDAGTLISFIVYKSVDGTDTEKVIDIVDTLYEENEGIKTMVLASEKNIVDIKDDITTLNSKIIDTNANLSAAVNDINVLEGKATDFDERITNLEGKATSPLWEGANTMGNGQTITPSKKLSECKNGWVLVWCGVNESGGATNTRFNTVVIPKTLLAAIPGNYMPIYNNLAYNIYTSGTMETVGKMVQVWDNKIVGFAGNTATDAGKGFCLKAVIEF